MAGEWHNSDLLSAFVIGFTLGVFLSIIVYVTVLK